MGLESRERIQLSSVLQMFSSLDLPEVLQSFIDEACLITDSPYGAISVLDNHGDTVAFFSHGISKVQLEKMGNPPSGRGIIGAIPVEGGLIINDLQRSTLFTGFPPGHPIMESFLGVPLRIHEQVYGRLYLCDRPGGYHHAQLKDAEALAAIAAVAVENSRLYHQSRQREKWTKTSQRITSLLLEGGEEEEALEFIAHSIKEVAQADTAMLILPSIGDTWACEIVDGWGADRLIGVRFPPNGRAMTVLREGQGLLVDSLQRATTLRVPELGTFGPALYAPLLAGSDPIGVLLLLRLPGQPEFEAETLEVAQSVVSQAALALKITSAKHASDMANLLDERAKIGEDLHDLAIQQLFATGMQLDKARAQVLAAINDQKLISELQETFDAALVSVDDSVKQIRAIVHNLREPDSTVDMVERLRQEASLARTSLGFAPSFLIDLDGQILEREDTQVDSTLAAEVSDRVGNDIADDVVAVVREALSNTARHAGASSASVRVSVNGIGRDGYVKVTVEDDGRGISVNNARRSGLDNLSSRARRHHGHCQVQSLGDGKGVTLIWDVPLA